MEIPRPITVAGTLVGLVFATCMPWPWPNTYFPVPAAAVLLGANPVPALGFQPWPLWRPDELPSWMPPGSWRLGLATGLAGRLARIVVVRAIRFPFRLGPCGRGLGLGGPDLMMMGGGFL